MTARDTELANARERLRAMLEGAGVRVVTTRTTDSRVNVRNVDWSGDGKVGYMDELAARVETANAARAAGATGAVGALADQGRLKVIGQLGADAGADERTDRVHQRLGGAGGRPHHARLAIPAATLSRPAF